MQEKTDFVKKRVTLCRIGFVNVSAQESTNGCQSPLMRGIGTQGGLQLRRPAKTMRRLHR